MINERTYSCNPSVFIVKCSLILDFLNRVFKNNQILIFKITVPWERCCNMQTKKPMDTQKNETNNRFFKIAKALKVNSKSNRPA